MINRIMMELLIFTYQRAPLAAILTFLIMMLGLYVENFKKAVCIFANKVRFDKGFRNKTFLVFYISLVLLETIFTRSYYENPLTMVWGDWKLYDQWGNPNTGNLENLLLFLPLMPLLLMNNVIRVEKKKLMRYTMMFFAVPFLLSLSIEIIQMIFHLGTFQLTDLVFNTLGGILGGIIYLLKLAIDRDIR